MNLLVTGAAGFIGSNFVGEALKKGHQVVGLDAFTYAGHKENLEEYKEGFHLVEGNICDQQLVESLLNEFQIDGVINFAAESHVDRSIEGPGVFIQTNIVGVYNLLDCGLKYWKHKKDFRMVQVSTDEVYGSLGDSGYFTENTPYKPNSPYSASKASGDFLARAWFKTYQFPVITTNCSNNYGPKQYPEKLIPHMIQCALKEKPLPVYGTGKNVRDWIHVSDHCQGVLLALEKGLPGETYCFGGRSERNNITVVKEICTLLDELSPRRNGKKYEELIQFVEDRKGHDWRYAIDDTKAQKELGFERQFQNFEEGLKNTVQWYLDHQNWVQKVLGEQ
ncbi:MAG: dTDP-glucose 4,6-dehydratase [Bdellovibrio sp.]|nr:MAG: dTDP-glucose 4,6-dehydratase [Bdellovibrio sp.]